MVHVELLYFWKLKQACSNLFLIATFEAKQMESSHILHLLRCLGNSMNPTFQWLNQWIIPIFFMVGSHLFHANNSLVFSGEVHHVPAWNHLFSWQIPWIHHCFLPFLSVLPSFSTETTPTSAPRSWVPRCARKRWKERGPWGLCSWWSRRRGRRWLGTSEAYRDGSMGNSSGKPCKAL